MPGKRIIGIDIGGTKISIVLGNSVGKIIDKKVLQTKLYDQAAESLQEIIETIQQLLKSHRCSCKDLLGIGVGIPGPIDAKKGIIKNSPNLPGWWGFNVRKALQKHFKCPFFCANDANAAAVAEKMFGYGQESNNFCYVTISTGIGSGIIINNRLVVGASNYAGEIGHLVIDAEGPMCGCGKKGCLEAFASGTAMRTMAQCILTDQGASDPYTNDVAYRAYKKIYPQWELPTTSNILEFTDGSIDSINSRIIASAAKAGDALAQYIYWRAGYYCGIGLSIVIQLLNLDVICLGGSIIRSGKLYLDSLNYALKQHTWAEPLQACKIVRAKLGDRVADIGALSLVLKKINYNEHV